MRRLSKTEYQNALRDLLRASTSEQTADAVMSEIRERLSVVPADAVNKNAPFARMDQNLGEPHVQNYFAVAVAVGRALTSSSARVAELLGRCSNGGTCIDRFIENFGKRVLRHPLNDEERAFYREVYASDTVSTEALADLIAVFLNAPHFLYEIQSGSPAGGGMVKLTDYEIASRLSFTFWRTSPDDMLYEAAEQGELSGEGFKAVLERVLDDPRAGETLSTFAREWLNLDSLRPLDALAGDPRFDAFAGENIPSPDLRDDMIREVGDSLVYHALQKPGTLADWLASPYSFARSEELAALYGVSAWDGEAEPPRFPEGERAGLLTRAALLATGTWNTRPIKKGAFIREWLLCDHLPSPPANAALITPEPSKTSTTRATVEALTEQPGSQCAGCHATQINPLGYATEGFDALGRVRTSQQVFDEEGQVIADLPLDTASVPRVWVDDETPSNGPADLTEQIIRSGKVEACFARQLVRFASSRAEDEKADGCGLETVRDSLTRGETIRDAIIAYAMLPSFRQRYAPDQE